MPTGVLHYRSFLDPAQPMGVGVAECRCMIGADHLEDGSVPVDITDDGDGGTDGLSVWEAADIWASNGKDEDYMFGYTREQLEAALND